MVSFAEFKCGSEHEVVEVGEVDDIEGECRAGMRREAEDSKHSLFAVRRRFNMSPGRCDVRSREKFDNALSPICSLGEDFRGTTG